MGPEVQRTKAQREAAYWVAVMELDAPRAEDVARFRRWIADPLHAEAYGEISGIWRASGQLDHLTALETPRPVGRTESRGRGRWASLLNRPLWRPAVALLCLVLLSITLFSILDSPFGPSGGRYVTELAEIRHLDLADGTTVTLGPKSRIDVDFTGQARHAVLHDGEAFFKVAKDPKRPFVLRAGEIVIRVIGTAFNVHEGPAGLTVAVAEGIVEVAAGDESLMPVPARMAEDPKRQPVRLHAGQQLFASRKGGLETIEAIAPDRPGAWRSGRLIYENSALSKVVADANRYSRIPIVIASPELGALPVFASFRTSQIDQMIEGLEDRLPLIADRSQAGRIVLRAKHGQE